MVKTNIPVSEITTVEATVVAPRSILPEEVRGVVFLTGPRGVGKTFLAATAEDPSKVLFLDYENKGRGIHNKMKFGRYIAVTEEASGKGPLGIWNTTAKAIEDIQPGQFTVAVLDNISPLEIALNAEALRGAAAYSRDFGLNFKNVTEGRFGGTKSIVNFLITDKVCAPLHAKGVQLIIATSHISAKWALGGPVPGKFSIKGADRWQELSIMTLVLIPGENAPVPSAIVQKEQLGSIMFDPATGEFDIKRRLPLRLPKATWSEIRRYLREPADLRAPLVGESPTKAESDPYSDDLSKEQISIMIAQMEADRAANAVMLAETTASLANPNQEVIMKIKNYIEDHPEANNAEIIEAVEGANAALVIKAKMNK
jgi:hypothetical protein